MNLVQMSRSHGGPVFSDADLHRAACAGDPDAFGRIVDRYQSLVASIAYSRTGDLVAAADFAQETFVIAWRRLGDVREPTLLKSWLAGIVRNLTANAVKQATRRGGSPMALDDIAEPAAREASPEARAVTQQEEALLWETLSQLPENYREPLVLFYREERSVAEVATQLDLSEDTVRQRLSRGRALLREEMTSLVESALSRSRPGPNFTAGVLAALALTAPAGATLTASVAVASSAGASSAGAAQSVAGASSAAKGTAAGIGAGAIAGPVAGLLTAWTAARLASRSARSDEERRVIARGFSRALAFTLPMIAVLLGFISLGVTRFVTTPAFMAVGVTIWTLALVGGLIAMATRIERAITMLRQHGGVDDATWSATLAQHGVTPSAARRWQSRARVLGLPLFAYASGGIDAGAPFGPDARRGARGWVAVGDLAISPLLAIGGIAIAPVALGGVTVGLVSLSIGGIALGAFTVGCLACGWVAYGIVAVGWRGAAGITAIAHNYAIGSQATAIEANSAAAVSWFRALWSTPIAAGFAAAVPVFIVLAIVIPLGLMARRAWRLRHLPVMRP